jgi:hypothetical protein
VALSHILDPLGLLIGLIISLQQTAWPLFGLTRIWLALRHRLPWRLMAFLIDVHQRGVLRQAGAVYQFQHIELQRRLANRDAKERQANLPAAATEGMDSGMPGGVPPAV